MHRKYYEAYDDRYRQIHAQELQWFDEAPSAIVSEVIAEFCISLRHRILEIGCGEGRDAYPLLSQGFDLLATDVSPEAVAYCRRKMPMHADRFRLLDCIADTLDGTFDFIYAVAVLHMLVTNDDRDAFYRFIWEHLKPDATALICTMGDGSIEMQSDINTAFELCERIHGQSGKTVTVAGTSCRMVSFDTFGQELKRNRLTVVRQGITHVEPDFPQMMYAIVKRADYLSE